MNLQKAIRSFDQNGVLGELTGIDAVGTERFFKAAYLETLEQIEAAREKAKTQSEDVYLDACRISGVNTGELFRVTPKGEVFRVLETFPENFGQDDKPLVQKSRPGCSGLRSARPLLLRAAYNGLWSPSGTNWQPIRTIELTDRESSKILSLPDCACGMVVLARKKYVSILADVACLCGFEQSSCAEWIDLGIWEMVAQLTARSHGWVLRSMPIKQEQCDRVSGVLIEMLRTRMPDLQRESQTACQALLASLKAGDHYPACVMLAEKGCDLHFDTQSPGGLMPSAFDRLVEARSTQRVASPNANLPGNILNDLFERAAGKLSETGFACPVFGRNESFPLLVGKAMHAGLEGRQGLLERASLENLKGYLCKQTGLDECLRAWTRLHGSELESQAKDMALPSALIPRYLRAKLQEVGQFEQSENVLIDRRGRTLGPVRLMKLVKLIARSFGQFFLSFHNTHPLLGVLLSEGQDRAGYIQAGRMIAYMSLLARAKGYSSIIKTGPLEIAGPAVVELLIQHLKEKPLQRKLQEARLSPVLTFQMGLPLGPFELVSAGLPAEHNGLVERRLDRRAPRAPLSAHYVPNIEEGCE